MKVFMIGGTGLLGSEAAKLLLDQGNEVVSLALPPKPTGANIPEQMELKLGNYFSMTDDELVELMLGCEGFVFAAGVDERVEGGPPIYELYKKYNIDAVRRLLRLAKKAGIKHAVICGSYFAHFAKQYPKWQLADKHPYIRSRIDQETVALAFSDSTFSVAVLELPYIFGTQPGRKPVWTFLIDNLRKMKGITLYPSGGTTMVTTHQVAQAIVGGLHQVSGGRCYPIGFYNLTWKEFLAIVQKRLGIPHRPIVTLPKWLYTMNSKKLVRDQAKRGIEGGLDMVAFTDLQYGHLFIDKSEGAQELGVTSDDIEQAINDSIDLSIAVLDHRVQALDMKAE